MDALPVHKLLHCGEEIWVVWEQVQNRYRMEMNKICAHRRAPFLA